MFEGGGIDLERGGRMLILDRFSFLFEMGEGEVELLWSIEFLSLEEITLGSKFACCLVAVGVVMLFLGYMNEDLTDVEDILLPIFVFHIEQL